MKQVDCHSDLAHAGLMLSVFDLSRYCAAQYNYGNLVPIGSLCRK